MDEKLLGTIAGAFAKEFASKGKVILEELGAEGDAFFKIGINRYLKKQLSKYAKIKTLLKGNTPTYIYDIFFPLSIRCEKKPPIDTGNASNVFKDSNYITIIGDAGSGKSTLVKHLFINSIQTNFAIPIMVELRYLNDFGTDIKSYIIDKILENKIQTNERIIERLLEKGSFIFFLDGYDELSSKVKQPLIQNLNSFVGQYSENKFILTSRPYSDVENMPLFHNYSIMNLSGPKGEIKAFIEKQLKSELELAAKIHASIAHNTNKYIDSFLTNPLLLSLYILTFQSDASIPDKKCIFYRRVVNALFSEHDSKTKLGYVREKLSGLSQEQFEEIQTKFCFISYFESKHDWSSDYINSKFGIIKTKVAFSFDNTKVVRDLKSAISLWVEDGGQYSFAHRSLQEYFAALLISNLGISEKERAYLKITDRLPQIRVLEETQNLLSLLEEMDYLYFVKFYKLPVLIDLRNQLITTCDDELVKSCLRFFVEKITLSDEKHRIITVNDKTVYKGIYAHIAHTRKIHSDLSDAAREFWSRLHPKATKSKKTKGLTQPETEIKCLTIQEIENGEFYEFCKPKILASIIELSEFVSTQISELNELISRHEKIDKELVDLI